MQSLKEEKDGKPAYDTSNSLQLFVTQGLLETKFSSFYLSAINVFLIHQPFQLPT